MLIKCPECNHENQLGAIFCRNCGAKLEIEKLAPEAKDQKSFSVLKIVRRLIALALVLILIGLAVGLFFPIGLKQYGALSQDQIEEVDKKLEAMFAAVQGKGRTRNYVLTPEETTYAFNTAFFQDSESKGGTWQIEKLIIAPDEEGYVHLVLPTKLAGKVPARFELKGTLSDSGDEENPIRFDIVQAKMGNFGFPGAVQSVVIDKFQPLLTNPGVQEFMKSVKSVELDEDRNFRLSLKRAFMK